MNNLPDFSHYGYQIIDELGHNPAGGRVTYFATRLSSSLTEDHSISQDSENSQDSEDSFFSSDSPILPINPVVIKEFQFASNGGASWASYDEYQREIQVLQGLNHPGIPQYLDSFQTPTGFCLVQEYKKAESLGKKRIFTPLQIQQIAIAILEILVYLQNRIPPVFHRDIKPENILVNDELNVYLIDFGFAHIGEGEVAMSSMVKGTLGFMPPEQLFNRELTPASDLYGVGASLICLLTGIKSVDIGQLIEPNYRINFQPVIQNLNPGLIEWLKKMVEPKPKDRFVDAATALEALKSIELRRVPQVITSHQMVQMTARKLGEQLTSTITIRNPVQKTMMTGRWQIAPHASDPKVKPPGHAWIYITPARFKSNKVECKIIVGTSKLMAGQVYNRQLLLHTNAAKKPYTLALKVQTAALPTERTQLPYRLLGMLFALGMATVWTFSVNVVGNVLDFLGNVNFGILLLLFIWGAILSVRLIESEKDSAKTGAIAGGLMGAVVSTIAFCLIQAKVESTMYGAITGAIMGSLLGAQTGASTEILAWRWTINEAGETAKKVAGGVAGALGGAWPLMFKAELIAPGMAFWAWMAIVMLVGVGTGAAIAQIETLGFKLRFAVKISLLTTALGISVGWGVQMGWHPLVILAIWATAIPIAKMIYPVWERSHFIRQYHQSESLLIKP